MHISIPQCETDAKKKSFLDYLRGRHIIILRHAFAVRLHDRSQGFFVCPPVAGKCGSCHWSVPVGAFGDSGLCMQPVVRV